MKSFSHNDNFHLCCLAQYPNLSEVTKQSHLDHLTPDARPVGVAIMNNDKTDESAKHYLDWVEYNHSCARARKKRRQ
jgi:hypothetical protein